MRTIGIVCLTALPISAFVERVVANPAFDTLPIRVSAGIVGGGLLFGKHHHIYFHYYWIFAITYILPFCFGAMLLLNAAYTPENASLSSIWIYQYLVAIFFFINLIHHGPLSTTLWIFASLLVALCLLAVPSPNWDALNHAALLPLPVYLTAVVVGSLMNRNVSMVQTEKLRAASAIGANLAHELRTPLASISALSKGAGNFLPILTEAYRKAQNAGIEVPPLRASQLSQLEDVLASIRNEVRYSNTIIDMLLVNTADKPLLDLESEEFSAEDAIREAVERFPFNNSTERKLINIVVDEDFRLVAPRLLIIHVLFNLIKNGVFFVQRAGRGQIHISANIENNGAKIIVHDTGAGISSAVRPYIFDRFYTTTNTGQSAGIGLSFCRLVMDSIGGSITCDSQEGEYTTFTLTFPNVRS